MAIKPLDVKALRALKLTPTMRLVLLTSGPLGSLRGDGNRHDKTFPALQERGLAEREKNSRLWWLTDTGMRARTALRMQIGMTPCP